MTLDRRLQCLLWLYITTLQGATGLSVVVSPSPTVQLVSGQTLFITCQWSADYTGSNAAVNYQLNDGGGRIGTLTINFGTACPSISPYTLTCNRDTRTLGIQIPASNYSHGDRWTCEGRNNSFDNTTPPQTDTTTVDVTVPVTSVTITPSTTVTVDIGTSTTLTCTTQPHSRPNANVTWYRVVSGQPQQIIANISVSHDTQNSAQTTTSALTYVPSKEDNGHTVYCLSDGGWTGSTATNLRSGDVILNIRYPPTNPAIVTGNSDPVYDGDDIELRCSIRGGNPLASLTWACPGRSVTSTTANTADTAVSVMRIRLTPLYNGANCTCVATHPAQGFMTSHTEVFNVYYAPRINDLKVTDPFPWLARDTYVGRLSCDTTAGNPSTTRYTWYRDGTPDSSLTSQTLSFDPPTSSDNGRLYKCRTENDFTDARGSASELDIILDVQYAPIITLSACPETVNETDNYRCTCTAVGNPNPTVIWYPRDSSTNNILDLPSINRNKAGRYTCNATSSSQKFGSLYTQSELNLVVQCEYCPGGITCTY
ncbi:synaptogenesis protein syg-2-like [Mizuhopecten yessoensis]|uniref:synaptogenesis protein syg-2-like n=1 Tax=Mizuhopecten yessoensis TaxID=6573 RepID=UPI000B45CCCC|nr:synaptogenesis protein syg-2-like [Mizuhopecten yessoensis]